VVSLALSGAILIPLEMEQLSVQAIELLLKETSFQAPAAYLRRVCHSLSAIFETLPWLTLIPGTCADVLRLVQPFFVAESTSATDMKLLEAAILLLGNSNAASAAPQSYSPAILLNL
jgi:hypothetical protein